VKSAALLLPALLACGIAGAAPQQEEAGVVRVNAIRNPELRSYRAIVAGMDTFDRLHGLAPAVPQLLFQVRGIRGGPLEGAAPELRLAADHLSIPVTVDEQARFGLPRSQAAWDAKAELMFNRRRREVQALPYIRTPGLAENQRRLGDLRLTCQVQVAIAKEEMSFVWVAALDAMLLTGDWCKWFNGEEKRGGQKRAWAAYADGPLAAATLREGERSLALAVKARAFSVPLGDAGWSDDAVVELEYAPAAP
jgi:hypothetical protein